MKVTEILGWRLTYWVARSLGYVFTYLSSDRFGACYRVTHPNPDTADIGKVMLFKNGVMIGDEVEQAWSVEMPNYAGDIAAAWPVIKADRISIDQERDFAQACEHDGMVYACMPETKNGQFHADPLIAAMRCKVASVFGETVGKEIE